MSDTPTPADVAKQVEKTDEQQQEAPRTFTQEEVEAMIRGRLAKFSDYDDVKKELDDLRKAGQTEQERAVAEARTEARAEALAEVNGRLINAEARAVAADMGFLYPQDAHFYIAPEAVKFNDDGSIDTKSVQSALEAAVKDRPALVKSDKDAVPSPSNAGIGVSAPAKPKTTESAWLSDVGSR